jgi:hypothetical protein
VASHWLGQTCRTRTTRTDYNLRGNQAHSTSICSLSSLGTDHSHRSARQGILNAPRPPAARLTLDCSHQIEDMIVLSGSDQLPAAPPLVPLFVFFSFLVTSPLLRRSYVYQLDRRSDVPHLFPIRRTAHSIKHSDISSGRWLARRRRIHPWGTSEVSAIASALLTKGAAMCCTRYSTF